jgi:glucan 1,3-beta-glucosidase
MPLTCNLAVNTDCAKWLNGRGSGARYDNTLKNVTPFVRFSKGHELILPRVTFPASCSEKTGSDPTRFSAEYTEFLRKSFETQTWVYEQAVSSVPLIFNSTDRQSG